MPPAQTPDPWTQPTAGLLAGPWEQAFYFVLRGRVGSKSNYRHGATSTHNWAQLAAFADQVALAARAARPRGWVTGDIAQTVTQRPTILTCIFARSMLDVGNLDKSILDAVEGTPRKGTTPARPGVVMVNDAQVAGASAWSVRTDEHPGALVAFARLPAAASNRTVAQSTAALTLACAALLPDT